MISGSEDEFADVKDSRKLSTITGPTTNALNDPASRHFRDPGTSMKSRPG